MHRAGAALAVIAAFLRAGQVDAFAKQIEQSNAGLEIKILLLPVDR